MGNMHIKSMCPDDQPLLLATAHDKRGYQINIFLIHVSPWIYICGYSLETPQQGTSNEHHNICFCGEIRKISILFGWKRRHIWCYGWLTVYCEIPQHKSEDSMNMLNMQTNLGLQYLHQIFSLLQVNLPKPFIAFLSTSASVSALKFSAGTRVGSSCNI